MACFYRLLSLGSRFWDARDLWQVILGSSDICGREKKEVGLGRGTSWAAKESQWKPPLTPQRALQLGEPFRVAWSWGWEDTFITHINHWVQPASGRGRALDSCSRGSPWSVWQLSALCWQDSQGLEKYTLNTLFIAESGSGQDSPASTAAAGFLSFGIIFYKWSANI